VKTPDRLTLTIKTDKREREYFYDGKTVTVYAPALKYYSVLPASDTIAKTIEEVESTYGVEVPLADLFYLGTKGSKADASNIISAFYVSDSTINGTVWRIFKSGFQRRANRFRARSSETSPTIRRVRSTRRCSHGSPMSRFPRTYSPSPHPKTPRRSRWLGVSRRHHGHRLDHEDYLTVSVADACQVSRARCAERSRAGFSHRSLRRGAGRGSRWRRRLPWRWRRVWRRRSRK
jgi:Predicted periplasmic protein (DUF2092)